MSARMEEYGRSLFACYIFVIVKIKMFVIPALLVFFLHQGGASQQAARGTAGLLSGEHAEIDNDDTVPETRQ